MANAQFKIDQAASGDALVVGAIEAKLVTENAPIIDDRMAVMVTRAAIRRSGMPCSRWPSTPL